MSFCQVCREELPGHQMGCPVLTGETVRGLRVGPLINEEHYQMWKSRFGLKLLVLEDAVIRAAYCDALDEGWVQGRQI
jgi:hypothetical protein